MPHTAKAYACLTPKLLCLRRPKRCCGSFLVLLTGPATHQVRYTMTVNSYAPF